MKKSLAILFAMVLIISLTVPAFALGDPAVTHFENNHEPHSSIIQEESIIIPLIQTDACGNPLDVPKISGVTIEEINYHTAVKFSEEALKAVGNFYSLIVEDKTTGDLVSEGNYSFYRHSDGAISVVLSNTYLQSLGSDTHELLFSTNRAHFLLTLNN